MCLQRSRNYEMRKFMVFCLLFVLCTPASFAVTGSLNTWTIRGRVWSVVSNTFNGIERYFVQIYQNSLLPQLQLDIECDVSVEEECETLTRDMCVFMAGAITPVADEHSVPLALDVYEAKHDSCGPVFVPE